jgi:hypothetical protein
MTAIVNQSDEVAAAGRTRISFRPLTGVALASFAALLLELALTRLFSVILFYHFAFLAISLALLGLGAGGVFAYLGGGWLGRYHTRTLGAGCCLANAVATLAALETVLHIPVSLDLSGVNFLKLTLIYLGSAVPFFFTGLLLSTVFAREARHIPMLYGADLAGGALACLAIVPLLDLLGGPNAVLFAGVATALASAVWALSTKGRNLAWAVAGGLILLVAANRIWDLVDVVYAKGVRLDSIAKVEFVSWNAISRIEVDRKADQSKWVVIDADANTALVSVDLNAGHWAWQGEWKRGLMSAPPSIANILRPRGDYAIIGPGGGVDVVRAIANGSPNVTGIEINSIIADTVMRRLYAGYTFGLYNLPQVHIVVSDGRSFIRSSQHRFDVIEMTLVDTWASTAAGAFALSESNLYTTEAFEEYFRHLRDDGLVAVTRWEFARPREALRVVSVALEALQRLGVQDTAHNFMVVSDGPLDEDGRAVIVLAKKSAFTGEEERQVQSHLDQNPNLKAVYMPSAPGHNPFARLIASRDPAAFARTYAYNVAPVTDDAPFFFFTLRTGQVLKSAALAHRGMDWKVSLGVVVLAMVLLISVAAVLALLVLPLALGARPRPGTLPRLIYFVAIGLGYILVEITFVQRFVLFLGHPTYAITVVIFLLLLASGAGSLTSRRWQAQKWSLQLPLAVIVVALSVYTFALPSLLAAGVGLPFAVKLLVSAAILIPLGLVMGMPFPTGLRALAQAASTATERHDGRSLPDQVSLQATPPESGSGDSAVEWAWALNAASSVLGSVGAILIAVNFGLRITLASSVVAYLAAWALAGTWRPIALGDGTGSAGGL